MKQLKITRSVTVRSETVSQYLADISKIPLLTPDEEAELTWRVSQGDDRALGRLVEANLRFVVSVAKAYQNRGQELPDLINDGNLGLMKAAVRFDPSRGFKFISYAVWWIRQSILQGLADNGRTVRLPLNRLGELNTISRARADFLQENEREPTEEEIAEATRLTTGRVGEALGSASLALSLDTPFGEDGDGTLLDVLPDGEGPAADEGLVGESLRSDLEDVMKVLAPRERDIVKLAFGIGCRERTLEEIGEAYHLTRERVRQLKDKAIRKMSRPKVRERLVQYR